MKNILYSKASLEELLTIVPSVVRLSKDATKHCLHLWSGESKKELRKKWSTYYNDNELTYILAKSNNFVVGCIGCEFDENLARGWIHGPMIFGYFNRHIASGLYDKLLGNLPDSLNSFSVFVNEKNINLRRFFVSKDFIEKKEKSYEYLLRKESGYANVDYSYPSLKHTTYDKFETLFSEIFPTAYYNSKQLLGKNGKTHATYLALENQELAGFIVSEINETKTSAEIQFLGVNATQRNRGIGSRLLKYSINWLFDTVGVERITLNVSEDLENAKNLYLKLGFERAYTGIGYYKNLKV